MEFLSEDPTYLASALGLIALGLLIALRVTQQGKYLIGALAALGMAGVVLLVEWLWVTDNERIEYAVYDLARTVARSDAAGVLDRMTPDVQFVNNGAALPGLVTREAIRQRIAGAKFDFVRVSQLRTHAGGQSRRGTAEFRVLASGSIDGPVNSLNFGTANSAWSLGFRETSPGVWKVDRITPVSTPYVTEILPTAPGNFPRGRGGRGGERRR